MMPSSSEPPSGELLDSVENLLEMNRLKRGAATAAAALGGDELKDLVPESTEIRGLRHASMYDPRMATAEDRDQALQWMRMTLPAIRRAVLARSPTLAGRLENYPTTS